MHFQTKLSRRALLSGLAEALAVAAQPRAITLLLGEAATGSAVGLFPRRAYAFAVTAALVAGATIANLIAAHNRRDTSVLVLGAINNELQVAVKQLADIQTSVARVYRELSTLPDKIDALLRQQDVRQLQHKIMGITDLYNEQLQFLSNYNSSYNWLTKQRISELEQYLTALRVARATFRRTNSPNDPTAALIAPSTAFLEVNLLTLTGRDSTTIQGTIQDVYLPWLKAILDPDNPNSAAGYTAASADRQSHLMQTAGSTKLGHALAMKPGTVLAGCVGVNDFDPAHNKERLCFKPDPNMLYRQPQSEIRDVSFLALRPESCGIHVPDRKGRYDRLWQYVTLKSTNLGIKEPASKPVWGLKLIKHSPVRKEFQWGKASPTSDQAYPGDSACTIHTKTCLLQKLARPK